MKIAALQCLLAVAITLQIRSLDAAIAISNYILPVKRAVQSKELDLVVDITKSIKENIVLIDTTTNIMFSNFRNHTCYFIEIQNLDEHRLKAIKAANTNSKLVYLVVVPEQMHTEEELIDKIRMVDSLNQIIAIYKKQINIEPKYGAGFYNIQFLIPKYGMYFQYGICMFCKNGKNKIELLNSWSNEGFKQQFTLSVSFKGTFFGKLLNVSALGNNEPIVNLNIEMCHIISNFLDAKFNFIEPTDKVDGCVRVSGNETSGMINDLLSGVSEIISYGCYGNLRAYTYADFSPVIEHLNNVILSVNPPKGLVWYSLFKPYDLITWLFVAISVPISGISLYVVSRFKTKEGSNFSFSKSLWSVITIICWEADCAAFRLKTTRQRLIIGAYAFMAMLLIFAYQGTVVALLSAPQFVYPPIDSKQMFLKSDRQWLTYGDNHEWYFQYEIFYGTDVIESKKKLFSYGSQLGPHGTALTKLLENPEKYVYFEDSYNIMREILRNFGDISGQHTFHFSKNYGSPNAGGYTYMLVRKSCFFKEAFDFAVGTLSAAGIFDHLRAVVNFKNEIFGLKKARKSNKNIKSNKSDGITLKYLWVPCGLISMGYLLAVIVIALEMLKHSVNKH